MGLSNQAGSYSSACPMRRMPKQETVHDTTDARGGPLCLKLGRMAGQPGLAELGRCLAALGESVAATAGKRRTQDHSSLPHPFDGSFSRRWVPDYRDTQLDEVILQHLRALGVRDA